ncbi:hypothetical protein H2198_010953 [Neophaeococcomyces mojaviensis]|uniref:Uncharacterized protein n=1 Tax=Neophaeococcomyces mojaviensis TaxID=3383035 RepID=A0ACC2ZNI0_9EURO|nr:hypothetical protein H2198_010953 [Knufia sp. JES_112]
MSGEVGAELVQRGRLQPRFEQALRLACALEQGAVDQLLDRAAATRIAGPDLHQRRCAHGQIDVMQGNCGSIAGQQAAAAVAAGTAHQAGLLELRQQAPDHHRMGGQARCQLLGGARGGLADQVRHYMQGVGKRVRGFHVTTIVTFKSSVESPHSFHMDTFVL